jgi:hypothetical protein
MTVLLIGRVPGDTVQFEAFMSDNVHRVEQLSEKAKAAGCISHRFAVGDGEVIFVDEWESAEQFQEFFAAPEIQGVVGEMGAQGEPQLLFADPKGFPGEF